MSSIMPEGTALRKAVQWVSQMRSGEEKTSLAALVDQACTRFNLSPKDCEFLTRFFKEGEEKKS
jgi:hypothetical protein